MLVQYYYLLLMINISHCCDHSFIIIILLFIIIMTSSLLLCILLCSKEQRKRWKAYLYNNGITKKKEMSKIIFCKKVDRENERNETCNVSLVSLYNVKSSCIAKIVSIKCTK